MTNRDMTIAALAARSDEVQESNCVADYFVGEDYRQALVFLEHGIRTRSNGDDLEYCVTGKRLIAVALCDQDDPSSEVEILDRNQVEVLFGRKWVENVEWVG